MKRLFAITGLINYLIVVFLNAFTDLGHKIIIQNTIFKVYDGEMQIVLTAIVNALILLPFVLMFSPSGFLADRFAKNLIMKHSSAFAVLITLGITYSYYNGHFYTAFGMTFLLALQSAIYGPAKYGYIKELVGIKFITSGNGAVQAVTTVAILGGIIFYTVLFEGMYSDDLRTKEDILKAIAPLGWLLVASSIVEWFLASKLPNKMIRKSQKSFRFKKYVSAYYLSKNLKIVRRKKEIFEAVIALSLFWSISQVVLAIFGEYAKSELGVTNTIFVQGVMALAGVGMVVGSLMAASFSKHYINTGLVAIGSVGITIIVFLVPFISSMGVMAFMFMLFGVFSGFVLVPLNAHIQFLSPNVHLGTILAGSNFVQNIFMFSFLAITTLFAYFGMNAEVLFYLMAFVGLYLSYMMFKRYFVMTFFATMEMISRTRHKYSYEGLENIPRDKAVLFLGNHVSWLDWIILQIPMKRPINFMMDKEIYNWPFFNAMFKKGETIPLSSRASKDAFKEAHKRLTSGKMVAVYPEGGISKDGELGKFYRGYELIPQNYDGVIIPFYIDGVFGSSFSKYKPKAKKSFFKRRKIKVHFSKPIAKNTDAEQLKDIIQKLKDKHETE
ncbi:MAG: 1-acyl-sn-glycerol-3-phosphate acyltransferase [Campylobacterota bacterium]|nr:1-acyl-sn-glycerol-3-phosphate acyltransferase [Campylobacterota bacterium]